MSSSNFRKKYEPLARQYAQAYGIDPDLFVAQINQESGFDPTKKSDAGAVGIAQIVPKWHPKVDPANPIKALQYAAGLMAGYFNNYKKQGFDEEKAYKLALAHYNGGPGGALYLSRNPQYFDNPDTKAPITSWKNQTANYAKKIFAAKNSLANMDPSSMASVNAAQEVLNYTALVDIAKRYGIPVTSTTGGKHNKGSKHYQGLAIDIDHRAYQKLPQDKRQAFDSEVMKLGAKIHDETVRPKGQAVWGGPHYHIAFDEVPHNHVVEKVVASNSQPATPMGQTAQATTSLPTSFNNPSLTKKDMLELAMYFQENALKQQEQMNMLKEENQKTSMSLLQNQRNQQLEQQQLQKQKLAEERKALEQQKIQEAQAKRSAALSTLNKIGSQSSGAYSLPQASSFNLPQINIGMPDFGKGDLFGKLPF